MMMIYVHFFYLLSFWLAFSSTKILTRLRSLWCLPLPVIFWIMICFGCLWRRQEDSIWRRQQRSLYYQNNRLGIRPQRARHAGPKTRPKIRGRKIIQRMDLLWSGDKVVRKGQELFTNQLINFTLLIGRRENQQNA